MSNLPIKKDENLFSRIKNFLKKLFWNKHENIASVESSNSFESDNKKKNEAFLNTIRTETDNNLAKEIYLQEKREKFLNEIDENPSLLENLSTDKLEKLNEYYNISINRYRDKINKIKGEDSNTNINEEEIIFGKLINETAN